MPVNCTCGNEISWAAAMENLSMNTPYYAVVCAKCHRRGPVARTEVEAAQKWNDYRLISKGK